MSGAATWRGHITHVIDNERRYVESLDDIAAFIARYIGRIEEPRRTREASS